MNWTGGSLSRSRKQNASLSVLQKRHFARARGKLLNGRPSPPHIDLSIFREAESDGTMPRGGTPSAPIPRRERQMTLGDFESLRPVVKQLRSLRPHRSPKTTPRSQRLTSPQGAAEGATELTPPTIVDELEAKRRELLATFDWVGLEKMKPVKMHFTNAEDRDLIGKRRLVKDSHAAETARVLQHRRRPLANAYDKLNITRARSQSVSSPGKISIHIGSSPKVSSAARRHDKGSNGGDGSRAPASDEMLLDDQESSTGAEGASTLAKNAVRRSTNTSDDMLFGPASSDGASPMAFGPTASEPLLQRQALSSLGNMFSRGSEPEYTFKARELDDATDDPRSPRRRDTHSTHVRDPEESTALRPSVIRRRLNPNEVPILEYPEMNRDRGSHSRAEHRAPCRVDVNRRSGQMMQPFPSSSTGRRAHETCSAQTKVQDFIEPLPPARFPVGNSWDIPEHGRFNTQEIKAIAERGHENTSRPQDIRKEQQRRTHIANVPKPPTPHSPAPPDQDDNVNTGAHAPSLPPALEPRSPNSEKEEEKPQAPADPSPEEDELLWRKFVFGTEDPANDWIFGEEAVAEPQVESKAQRMTNSSSPLQPIFNAADVSPGTRNHDSPQTHTQTQPSLLVEASSSPSAPFSPNDLQSIQTNPSQPHPSSGDPPETQHSIQAQASTSPLQASNTSSDPLSYSPSRLLQPPVTFRKPDRYVGESQKSVRPVRLGVGRGKRKRKRKRGEVDGEDEGWNGERESRGKKGRREWAGGLVEEIDGEEGEGDEIVDD
ncbi:MAG: hypothetical protein L6R36_001012 [Xanthoria steineri]|nr:MAG: hypothetical protein L6R36_001012 [Xanthoria steineri]